MNLGSHGMPERGGRTSVSVCMATYNGERFVEEQVASILVQLGPLDELIIVDDASSDGTRERIRRFQDSRIQMYCSLENAGVLASFERALTKARGEIIFFSDQDDVWHPDKVSKILDAFEHHPEVTLIATDSVVIDEAGRKIADSYYATRSPFRVGFWANLIHFRYQGCGMAVRRSILPSITPFPREFQILHDLWVGLANSFAGNQALFLDEQLFSYRRHSSNASGRLPRLQQIRVRWDLIRAVVERFVLERAKSGAQVRKSN